LTYNLEQEIQIALPIMKDRLHEVESLRRKLNNLDHEQIGSSDRYYPVRFFTDGVSAYVYMFDNAAIFYAWAAVEHSLLIRIGAGSLRQFITANSGRYPGERRLVNIARENGIISRDKQRIAHRLRNLRNNYLHYINIMWDQHNRDVRLKNLVQSKWPIIVKEIHDAVPIEEQYETMARFDLMKIHTLSEKTIQERQIPFVPGDPPNSEGARFVNRRYKQFIQWVQEVADVRERLERYKYGIERKDALDGLLWSADLLTYLKFLPK
jgi:hypothetical protein